jgi:hypothetical protein
LYSEEEWEEGLEKMCCGESGVVAAARGSKERKMGDMRMLTLLLGVAMLQSRDGKGGR